MTEKTAAKIPLFTSFLCVLVLSFVHDYVLLMVLLSLLLLVTVSFLAYFTIKTVRLAPMTLALFSSMFLFMGKFTHFSDWHASLGVFGLFVASAMNFFATFREES